MPDLLEKLFHVLGEFAGDEVDMHVRHIFADDREVDIIGAVFLLKVVRDALCYAKEVV